MFVRHQSQHGTSTVTVSSVRTHTDDIGDKLQPLSVVFPAVSNFQRSPVDQTTISGFSALLLWSTRRSLVDYYLLIVKKALVSRETSRIRRVVCLSIGKTPLGPLSIWPFDTSARTVSARSFDVVVSAEIVAVMRAGPTRLLRRSLLLLSSSRSAPVLSDRRPPHDNGPTVWDAQCFGQNSIWIVEALVALG